MLPVQEAVEPRPEQTANQLSAPDLLSVPRGPAGPASGSSLGSGGVKQLQPGFVVLLPTLKLLLWLPVRCPSSFRTCVLQNSPCHLSRRFQEMRIPHVCPPCLPPALLMSWCQH